MVFSYVTPCILVGVYQVSSQVSGSTLKPEAGILSSESLVYFCQTAWNHTLGEPSHSQSTPWERQASHSAANWDPDLLLINYLWAVSSSHIPVLAVHAAKLLIFSWHHLTRVSIYKTCRCPEMSRMLVPSLTACLGRGRYAGVDAVSFSVETKGAKRPQWNLL